MRHLFAVTLLIACSEYSKLAPPRPTLMLLLEFRKMINQATRKSAILSYYGYGCYCGSDGKGEPKDATDWCCHAHDCCYGKMSARGCDPKLEFYSYSIQSANIACGKTPCKKLICECDKAAALCFQRAARTFRRKYLYYPNTLCKGPSPPC
uniref:Phospholipase A2 n=1 Tax=Chelydra serpentina TaxID=8475 RepID=A0A8C3XT24_CHESE